MQTTEENVTTMLPVDTESWWAWTAEAVVEVFGVDPDEGFSVSEAAVTVSFLTLAFGQLWRVVAMWQPESGVFSNEVTRNRYVWAAAWGLIALLSLVPLGVGQIMLLVRRYNNRLSTPR